MSDAIASTHEFDRGYSVNIMWDPEPGDPRREWENGSRLLLFHRSYNLGDDDSIREDVTLERALSDADLETRCSACDELVEQNEYSGLWEHESGEHEQWTVTDGRWTALPADAPPSCGGEPIRPKLDAIEIIGLRAYDGYRGANIEVVSDDQLDDATGFIYMTEPMIREAYMIPEEPITDDHRAKARELMKGEIEVYNQYLCGDVYGWELIGPEGEHLDSCWGYYGDEAEEDMIEEARSMAQVYIDRIDAEEAAAQLPILLACEAA